MITRSGVTKVLYWAHRYPNLPSRPPGERPEPEPASVPCIRCSSGHQNCSCWVQHGTTRCYVVHFVVFNPLQASVFFCQSVKWKVVPRSVAQICRRFRYLRCKRFKTVGFQSWLHRHWSLWAQYVEIPKLEFWWHAMPWGHMATRLDRATFQSSLASIGKGHLFWKRGSLRESAWNIDILHIENIIYTVYIYILYTY